MLKKVLLSISVLCLVFLIIAMPQSFSQGVLKNIQLCINRVIPSLFLFMVISNFAVNSGALQPVIKLFAPVMKLWGLSKNCFEALFWGSFSGFPVGAKLTAQLYSQNKITRSEAENLLSFCNNCSPAFLIGMMGKNGFAIYFIQLACALLTGLYICKKSPSQFNEHSESREYTPVIKSFVTAVKASALGILNVCAFIVFTALITVLLNLLNISHPLIIGFFEITSGISEVPYISPFYFACVCFMAGWGSVSVLLQSLIFVNDASLSMRKYVLGKAVNGILCFICGYMYFTDRLYLFIALLIITVFLRKIGKTIFGEKNADRQFSKKHRSDKRKNEKQLHL